jgi:hypothetical protein
MPDRSRAIGALVALLVTALLVTALLAGCSATPVSQATSLAATPGATATAASDAPPEESPTESQASPVPATPAPLPPTEVPPKPGDPTFTLTGSTPNDNGTTTDQYTITWTEPAGVASAFLVYGMTVCLRDSKAFDGQPCVVRGMKISRDTLVLLGQVPGDARSMTVSWEAGEGPAYWAILMRATNAIGDSIFTIVHSEDVCFQCTY